MLYKRNKFISPLLLLFIMVFITCMPSKMLYAQSIIEFSVHNDYAITSPMQKVKVDVTKNDTLPCNEYVISIVNGPTATQGTAEVQGDYIIYTPALNFYNDQVSIEYSAECNGDTKNAFLYINVREYNNPVNIIPYDAECIEEMPSNVPFGIREKFRTSTSTGDCVDLLSSPLVGDLNGDGKPEIVAMGVPHYNNYPTARNTLRYINIFNGQDGTTMYRYDLGQDYAQGTGGGVGEGYHRPPVLLALADLDNDGTGEIIITTPLGEVKALKPIFNGAQITDMSIMWTASVSFKAPLTLSGTFNTPHPYIVDINGDGIPEVIVYNKIYNAKTGDLLMSWQGAASSPTSSSITSSTGLADNSYTSTTSQTNANNIKNVAMTGRRPSSAGYTDRFTAVPAIWDIDGDGIQEIITGNRIYKIQINSLTDHTQNTYTTIEGPVSVSLPENPNMVTHYLNDGFTRIADIDGDGNLDIIVATLVSGALDVKILVYVWDPQSPDTVKAALTYLSDGIHGSFGIPFIGDINGKEDGWDGSAYTKKLPEICILSGAAWINRGSSNDGRSGIKFHPLTDEKLRQGAITYSASNPTAAGWDNNQISNSYRRFNQYANEASLTVLSGHIIALTYDASATNIEDRLMLSWAMEHKDGSDNTGITLFDFDNDGAKDLCYRDERTLRVISPKKGNNGTGSDYITVTEDETTAGTSVMFRTDIYSGTGFEYPAIADVNLDGTANIIVTGGTAYGVGLSAGSVRVYEYQGAKWAPAPQVWNQSLYNPLHINEDLTVPAKPMPLLTNFIDGNGNTIQPYNGAWIQQPIVREGEAYVPVYRLPDAVLVDMRVTVNVVSNNPKNATIRLTIRNDGTASISANSPIAFYMTPIVAGIENAQFICTLSVGKDIFPNTKEIIDYTLPDADYNNQIIWARLIDDGVDFPATNYEDCDISNNAMEGIDCPYLSFEVVSVPSSGNICGQNGVVLLKAYPTDPNFEPNDILTYQWYIGTSKIDNATDSFYFATTPGEYRCYLIDGICRGFTTNSIDVQRTYDTITKPDLLTIPKGTKICSAGGSVYLYINNSRQYTNPRYDWYKDNQLIQSDTISFYSATEEGTYFVHVADGNCSGISISYTIETSTIGKPDFSFLTPEAVCSSTPIDLASLILEYGDTTDLVLTYHTFDYTILTNTILSDVQDTIYHIIGTNADFCSDTSSVRVTILSLPVIDNLGNDSICVGTTTQLYPASGGVWSSNNPSIASVDTDGIVTGKAEGNATFTFTSSETQCSATTDTIVISVFPLVNKITGDISMCVGETREFSCSTQGGVWRLSNENIIIEGSPNDNPVNLKGITEGTTFISYTVGTYCQTTITSHIKILPQKSPTIIIGY